MRATFKKIYRLSALMARRGFAPIALARRAILEHGATQRTWELSSLIALARARPLQTVLEIGTDKGGTLYCWATLASDDAHLVIIDIPSPEERLGFSDDMARRFNHLLKAGQRLTWVKHSSQTPDALAEVTASLAGAPIDLLWLDGDHHYEAIRRDFEMYAPLVRPGGLIAFHDVHPNPAAPDKKVHVLWREIRNLHRSWTFIDQDHAGGTGMGIGVLEWPGPK